MPINFNGNTLFDGAIPVEGLDRTLALPALPEETEAEIEIISGVMQPPGDPRTLGVAVESLRFST